VLKKSPHNFGVGRLSLRVRQIAVRFPMPSAFKLQSGAAALTSFPARGFFSALLGQDVVTLWKAIKEAARREANREMTA